MNERVRLRSMGNVSYPPVHCRFEPKPDGHDEYPYRTGELALHSLNRGIKSFGKSCLQPVPDPGLYEF